MMYEEDIAKVNEWFDNRPEESYGTYRSEREYSLDEFDIISRADEEMDEKLAEAEWIPCSERLPQLEDYVIVSLMWGEVDIMALDWDDGEINWITQEMSIRHDKEDIVAWMPLPKPYREDGEV